MILTLAPNPNARRPPWPLYAPPRGNNAIVESPYELELSIEICSNVLFSKLGSTHAIHAPIGRPDGNGHIVIVAKAMSPFSRMLGPI